MCFRYAILNIRPLIILVVFADLTLFSVLVCGQNSVLGQEANDWTTTEFEPTDKWLTAEDEFGVTRGDYERSEGRSCLRRDLVFVNNSPVATELVNNDLFCVVYDNSKVEQFYEEFSPAVTLEKFAEYENKRRFRTVDYLRSEDTVSRYGQQYKTGDPVLIVPDHGVVTELPLPHPSIASTCNYRAPARYICKEFSHLQL
ncbi:unnamed protein product [Soboliphyme baturini]|uniref:DUF1619 domain-containing protein n=1 Tax=Soboliphyme baturini TaxID=241478 RepID=A0A183I985_9BILA|nr:unnamed protein product [Soboliphyme baturini]